MQGAILFEPQTVGSEVTAANISSCLGRGLPELERDFTLWLPGRHGMIVANGPSAVLAPFHRRGLIAVNGALDLFRRRGCAPRYWVACDPGEVVAGFLKDPPRETVYLVASKCHPSVFDALEGRDVRVWHCLEEDSLPLFERRAGVPGGISVTLRTMELFRRFAGAQSFETWGWDASFGCGGIEHAVSQAPVASPRISVTVPGEGRYETTHQWAAEVDDAQRQLREASYRVTVRGPGLMGAALRALCLAPASNDLLDR